LPLVTDNLAVPKGKATLDIDAAGSVKDPLMDISADLGSSDGGGSSDMKAAVSASNVVDDAS